MRAIKRWQEETGKREVWPDHADLCVWLLKQNEKLQANLDRCYGGSPSIYMEMCQDLVKRDEEIARLKDLVEEWRAYADNEGRRPKETE